MGLPKTFRASLKEQIEEQILFLPIALSSTFPALRCWVKPRTAYLEWEIRIAFSLSWYFFGSPTKLCLPARKSKVVQNGSKWFKVVQSIRWASCTIGRTGLAGDAADPRVLGLRRAQRFCSFNNFFSLYLCLQFFLLILKINTNLSQMERNLNCLELKPCVKC